MLDRMTLHVLAPLEAQGYILPAKLMPDIALGLMFMKWLRENDYDPDSFPTYPHEFTDHRPTVQARLYPNSQLKAWLTDGRARKYFAARDENAIEPLEKVVARLPPSAPPLKGLPPGREQGVIQ